MKTNQSLAACFEIRPDGSGGEVDSAKMIAKFNKMSFQELSSYIHELEITAARARFALWKRHEAAFMSN